MAHSARNLWRKELAIPGGSSVWVGASYHNDVSPPLRDMPAWSESDLRRGSEREVNENPKIPYRHIDSVDPVVQNWDASVLAGRDHTSLSPFAHSMAFLSPAWAVIALRLTRTGPWG